MTGLAESMLTLIGVATLSLPALSTALPPTSCSRPSLLSTTSAGQVAMVDSASLQVKPTVTGPV